MFQRSYARKLMFNARSLTCHFANAYGFFFFEGGVGVDNACLDIEVTVCPYVRTISVTL